MFKKILVVLVIAVAVFAGVVAMQPAEFRVERSATMAAPAPDVFAQVNDFHNWEAWSPWAKLDPNAKNTFSGPAAGKDAKFSWAGNDEVGVGSMTILESRPHDLIRIAIDFEKPHQNTSMVDFTFKPVDNQTVVTWSMYGKNDFMSKAICLFMNMDKMVGEKFEEGLANLKKAVETKKDSGTPLKQ
jgi:uncharacterized protein YndB with AHSA1/START domain